jgi:hypothetical protein
MSAREAPSRTLVHVTSKLGIDVHSTVEDNCAALKARLADATVDRVYGTACAERAPTLSRPLA